MPAPKPPTKLANLAQQIANPGSTLPLELLDAIRQLRPALEDYETRCVAAARKNKATWDDVGAATGKHRQNAQRKWADRV